MRHRRCRHNVAEPRRPEVGDHSRVELTSVVPQGRQQRVLERCLPERDENGGTEVLGEDHEGGADGEVILGQVRLDRCDGLLRHHTPGYPVQQLIANPGRLGGGGGEGCHQACSDRCEGTADKHEWCVIADVGDYQHCQP